MIATRLDDVAFFPSDRGFGYNFFATSADKNSMLFVDLESGKVEMIDGEFCCEADVSVEGL